MADQKVAGLDHLDPAFAMKIAALIEASHGKLYIASGYRSPELQAQLYANAVKKYGEAGAGKWVAPPGHSNHGRGIAVDLGGDLEIAHQLAPQFGLVFPMSWEAWHIEPVGARDHQPADPQAYTQGPPATTNPVHDDQLGSQPEFLVAALANAMAGALDPTRAVPLQPGTADQPQPAAAAAAAGAGGGSGGGVDRGGAIPMSSGGGAYGGVNRSQWATDFLTRGGFPVTSENKRAIEAWMQAESGGGGGKFNPLNTTQGGFAGETNLNSVGVKNYTNYEHGIEANLKVINNGLYKPILNALHQGNSAIGVAHAIGQTPWGTGHLVEKILGG